MKPLLLIVGASGSGKTSLCMAMEEKYGLKQIPSYTTRPRRSPNEQGHTFITKDEFDAIRSDIVAYATTDGNEYGVTNQQIDNEDYTLYVIDNTGLKYLKEKYTGKRPFVSVFIDCPLGMRYERMRERTDYKPQFLESTLNRIIHDAVEFKDIHTDYVIANNDGMFSNALTKLTVICIDNKIIETEEI